MMKTLMRIFSIPLALALPALAAAAPLPGMNLDAATLPPAAAPQAARPDCWVDHVQVQPGRSSGASGASGNSAVSDPVVLGKLESAGHPGSEHRPAGPRRSTACSRQLERRAPAK